MKNTYNFKYLFLDRDGVINVERKNDYVKNKDEFIFEKDVIKALKILNSHFERIFIITNQRGVNKGFMTLDNLHEVHDYMLSEINNEGINISKIYFCTDICSVSINRKPNIGMAFQAKRDYPEVVFKESIMVGNSKSDILFGNKLDMHTILVGNKYNKDNDIFKIADTYFSNLYEFALSLR